MPHGAQVLIARAAIAVAVAAFVGVIAVTCARLEPAGARDHGREPAAETSPAPR